MSDKWRNIIEPFRPQTTFWRFFIAASLIAAVTAVCAMIVSMWIGRNMVHELQQDSAYTVLRNTVDLIGRARIAIEEHRTGLIENRKERLADINEMAVYILDSHLETADAEGSLTKNAGPFKKLQNVFEKMQERVYVVDSSGRMVVHPDPLMRGRRVSRFLDAESKPFLNKLAEKAREAGRGRHVFTLYTWDRGGGLKYRLAAAYYYPRIDAVVGADVPIGDYEKVLAEKSQAVLNELRARIGEIVIGKSGYVYVFNEDCEMLAHPTLVGGEFASMRNPDTGKLMCGQLKQAAEKPWGKNKYHYDWDMPNDRGNYVYPKISWVTREPATGWYVGISAYIEEFESTLPRFIMGIFLPSLGSILLLGGALALLLHNLLKPVHQLTRVTQRVSEGDLEAEAPEDVSGEVGFLCRHFNVMVRRLAVLRKKEQHRRSELEELNKNLERIVEVRTKDLREKARKLEEANIRLRELDEMKSNFLSSVSHELRTPLTSVRGFAKLIDRDFDKHFSPIARDNPNLRKKARRLQNNVEIIAQEGERLTRLINDVLDLSKIETGAMRWNDSFFSMNEVIVRSADAISSMAVEKEGVELSVDVEPDMPEINADPDRITQLLINLLDNALKFTTEGTVKLRSCSRDQWIRVEISDRGRGVSRDSLLKIFDKFYQTESKEHLVEAKPAGTGLGLAICHNIVNHYGGFIWAESAPGRGTTVYFELPAKQTAPSELAESDIAPAVETRTKVLTRDRKSLSPPTVLVVDDEPSIRSYLHQVFGLEGFRVVTAEDGKAALEMAEKHRPDLITMDIFMPGMDGREAIVKLRKSPELSKIPIVVVTVMEEEDDIESDAYVTKPIDDQRLIGLAKWLLHRDRCVLKPCIMLESDAVPDDNELSKYCSGDIRYMNAEELTAEIEDGFQGTVLLRMPLEPGIDLEKFSSYSEAQIVILPRNAGDEE